MEVHGGVAGGSYMGRGIVQKILWAGLWWLTVHKDSKAYWRACDVCQITRRPLWRDGFPLNPQVSLKVFDKWAIYFMGSIQPLRKKTMDKYIIIATEYLIKWVEEKPIKDCSPTKTVNFIFEYFLSRFGYPKILMSDRVSHFLDETIVALLEEFHMHN